VKGGNQFLKFATGDEEKTSKPCFEETTGYEEDAREFFIPVLPLPHNNSTDESDGNENDVSMLSLHGKRAKAIQVALEDLRTEKQTEVDAELTKTQLDHMEQLSKINPFSIHPILVYLEKKKYEVFNLRAIARGKESRLAGDTIAKYLVI
jgi:V/A-type H+-transporting ATPase subunit C